MKRTLTLARDVLAVLGDDDLREVAAGQAITVQGFTCAPDDCFRESNLGPCYTWLC